MWNWMAREEREKRKEGGASALARHGWRAALVAALSLVALLVAACGTATTPGAGGTPTTPGAGGTPTGYKVDVYFSHNPDFNEPPSAVYPVHRTSPTLGVATYAISQLLAGPTATEAAKGYYTPLQGALSGASTCGGADFTITLNSNRGQPETGTATLKFCRDVKGLGDTGAAMARNEIDHTLTQFPSIKKVVIIYKDGSCFDDMIGCG